jgi:hypothetical protein
MNAMGTLVDPDTYSSILWRWLDAAAVLQNLKYATAMAAEASPTKSSSVNPEQGAAAAARGGNTDPEQAVATEKTKENTAAETKQTAAGAAGAERALWFSGMSTEGLQLFLQFGYCRFLDQSKVLAAVLEWYRDWNESLQDTEATSLPGQEQQEGSAPANSRSSKSGDGNMPAAVTALLAQLEWQRMSPAALQLLADHGDLLGTKTLAGKTHGRE